MGCNCFDNRCICIIYRNKRRHAEKDLEEHVQDTEMVDTETSNRNEDINGAGEGEEKKEQANVVAQGGVFIPMQMNAPFIAVPVYNVPGQNADLPPQPKVNDTETDSEDDDLYDNENNPEAVVTSGGQGQTNAGDGNADEPVLSTCTPQNE
eukprot:981098_1